MVNMIPNYKERKEWKNELTERERLQRHLKNKENQ